jgi:hypothetical protein
MFAGGVEDWPTSEHNPSLYLTDLPFAFAASINWIAVLKYLSFVQLALTLGEAGRKCDAQVLIKKISESSFLSDSYLGRIQPQKWHARFRHQ